MLIPYLISAFIFCLIGCKLVAKTQKSGRIWLNLFAIFLGLIPVMAIIAYDKNAVRFLIGFVMAVMASVGAVIAIAIDTYLDA